eukprot:TRINITY_DN1426_c0_g1_i1.p1 TRINITY_DN1426_c0_g1~~TRINITY_DN1426_c0_g1_i1.p1  ORF type:complete len:907 (+),score=210.57 TRINITY_DN1426_c0_g1_i1:68-2788(+)
MWPRCAVAAAAAAAVLLAGAAGARVSVQDCNEMSMTTYDALLCLDTLTGTVKKVPNLHGCNSAGEYLCIRRCALSDMCLKAVKEKFDWQTFLNQAMRRMCACYEAGDPPLRQYDMFAGVTTCASTDGPKEMGALRSHYDPDTGNLVVEDLSCSEMECQGALEGMEIEHNRLAYNTKECIPDLACTDHFAASFDRMMLQDEGPVRVVDRHGVTCPRYLPNIPGTVAASRLILEPLITRRCAICNMNFTTPFPESTDAALPPHPCVKGAVHAAVSDVVCMDNRTAPDAAACEALGGVWCPDIYTLAQRLPQRQPLAVMDDVRPSVAALCQQCYQKTTSGVCCSDFYGSEWAQGETCQDARYTHCEAVMTCEMNDACGQYYHDHRSGLMEKARQDTLEVCKCLGDGFFVKHDWQSRMFSCQSGESLPPVPWYTAIHMPGGRRFTAITCEQAARCNVVAMFESMKTPFPPQCGGYKDCLQRAAMRGCDDNEQLWDRNGVQCSPAQNSAHCDAGVRTYRCAEYCGGAAAVDTDRGACASATGCVNASSREACLAQGEDWYYCPDIYHPPRATVTSLCTECASVFTLDASTEAFCCAQEESASSRLVTSPTECTAPLDQYPGRLCASEPYECGTTAACNVSTGAEFAMEVADIHYQTCRCLNRHLQPMDEQMWLMSGDTCVHRASKKAYPEPVRVDGDRITFSGVVCRDVRRCIASGLQSEALYTSLLHDSVDCATRLQCMRNKAKEEEALCARRTIAADDGVCDDSVRAVYCGSRTVALHCTGCGAATNQSHMCHVPSNNSCMEVPDPAACTNLNGIYCPRLDWVDDAVVRPFIASRLTSAALPLHPDGQAQQPTFTGSQIALACLLALCGATLATLAVAAYRGAAAARPARRAAQMWGEAPDGDGHYLQF